MSRPEMRFIAVKSADQQAMLMLHKTRELLIKQRTMSVNALRGHLSEFGLVAAKGIHRVKDLIALAQAQDHLPEPARQATGILAAEIAGLDARIDELEAQIERASATNPMSRLLDQIPVFGPMIASAMVAFHPDPRVFRSASDLPASLGLTPGQHSSGGKEKLGAIIKKGNRYLRKMLVVGGASVVRVAHKYNGALAEWIVAMRARKPERVVAVALANKLARIAWAMMTTGESFRTELYVKA
jgi:transposase